MLLEKDQRTHRLLLTMMTRLLLVVVTAVPVHEQAGNSTDADEEAAHADGDRQAAEEQWLKSLRAVFEPCVWVPVSSDRWHSVLPSSPDVRDRVTEEHSVESAAGAPFVSVKEHDRPRVTLPRWMMLLWTWMDSRRERSLGGVRPRRKRAREQNRCSDAATRSPRRSPWSGPAPRSARRAPSARRGSRAR